MRVKSWGGYDEDVVRLLERRVGDKIDTLFIHTSSNMEAAEKALEKREKWVIVSFAEGVVVMVILGKLVEKWRHDKRESMVFKIAGPTGLPYLDGWDVLEPAVKYFPYIWDAAVYVIDGDREVPAALVNRDMKIVVATDFVHEDEGRPVAELLASLIEFFDGPREPDIV